MNKPVIKVNETASFDRQVRALVALAIVYMHWKQARGRGTG